MVQDRTGLCLENAVCVCVVEKWVIQHYDDNSSLRAGLDSTYMTCCALNQVPMASAPPHISNTAASAITKQVNGMAIRLPS